MTSNLGKKEIVKYIFQYLFAGWAFCFYLVFRDTYSFIKILWNEDGFKENYDDEQQDGCGPDRELVCFNEIRIIALKLFIKKK